MQIDASLSENTITKKFRIIGSDNVSQTRFFQSLTTNRNRILFDLSGTSSQSENSNLAEKGHNPKHITMIKSFSLLSFPEAT